MSEIELQDLSNSRAKVTNVDNDGPDNGKDNDNEKLSGSFWAWSTATLLLASAACLTLFPRLLRFLSQTDVSSGELTPLESFLALHLGIFLAAISAALALNIPSNEPVVRRNEIAGHPILLPISVASSLSAFLSYNTYNVGSLSTMVFVVTSIIGIWGLWEAVFAGTGLTSKKTGADKHTSSFLFGNKNAASVKKKAWKREQAASRR